MYVVEAVHVSYFSFDIEKGELFKFCYPQQMKTQASLFYYIKTHTNPEIYKTHTNPEIYQCS